MLPEIPRCVLVGIRRSGKSYLLYSEIQRRLKAGQSWDDMLYLNFEDERLLGFEATDFNQILAVHAELCGNDHLPALFLDEIQIIDGWEKFARRMADAEAKIYITGSNAKLLSTDVAASLGGRFMTVNVFPLSFSETLRARGIDFGTEARNSTTGRALIRRGFKDYFERGGFPECVELTDNTDYLNNLFQKIYLGDISVRNGIRNIFPLRVMLKKLAESIGQPLSFSRIASIVSATGAKLTTATAINYLTYACDACLLLPIENFFGKLQDRESNKKYYFADNGLISLLRFDAQSDLLENLVALTLIRRYGNADAVFYFQHQIEVDFYLPAEETAIQVCVDLSSHPNTMKRELDAFEKLAKYLPVQKRLVITLDEERTLETKAGKVELLPAWRWLLGV